MAADRIGTRIKKRRQVLRMTQEVLAARLGVSKSTVANWERGKHFPLRYLGAIEDLLGVSLDDEVSPPPLTPETQAVLRRELGEERFREVMAFLERRAGEPESQAG